MGIGKYAQAININQALLKLLANQHFINYSRQIEINYLKQRRVLKVFGPGDLIFGFFLPDLITSFYYCRIAETFTRVLIKITFSYLMFY